MKSHKYLLLAALVVLSATSFAHALDSVNIYQIAATGDPVPGTGGTFTSFSAPTANRDVDENVPFNPFSFIATSSNGNSGVYYYDTVSGAFTDVADTTMTAATGGNYASFSSLSSGVGALGFIATDSNGVQGVYAEGSTSFSLIATSNTDVISGTQLGNIQAISITGNPYGSPAGVIQSDTGEYSFIESPSMLFGNFNTTSLTSFGPISFKGSLGNSNLPGIHLQAFAFVANSGSARSVYFTGPGSNSSPSGEIALARVGASIPDGNGTFTIFGNPIATANEVCFTAHYSTSTGDQQGIFVYGSYETLNGESPELRQIVATGQVAPNSGGATFTGFSDISDSSFDETFIASLSNGGEGLYIEFNEGFSYSPGPQLLQIAATGEAINGKTILGFALAPDASNYYESPTIQVGGDNLGTGFEVFFTDGSEGLYYFTINLPEPASFGLLALPALSMFRRR